MVIAVEGLVVQSLEHISPSRPFVRPCVQALRTTPSAIFSSPSGLVDFPSLTYSPAIKRQISSPALGGASWDASAAFKLGNFGALLDVNPSWSASVPFSAPIVRAPYARPVNAAIAETAEGGLKWWEKSGPANMSDVHCGKDFVDALSAAGDNLVIVEFYATWCGSCRALYPKLCKLAAESNDISFLKVNFDENKRMCKALNVKVLPYFHIYRGAAGRLDSFSCSLSKLQKLKDAIAKHHEFPNDNRENLEPFGDLLETLLEISPADRPAGAAGSSV